MKLSREVYIQNPCAESSLPYWKTVDMIIPENIMIRHHRDFCEECLIHYIDEPYFCLYHDLQWLHTTVFPNGFQRCDAAPAKYAAHINQCYLGTVMRASEIEAYFQHRVYDPELWIAVQDRKSGEIAATGIAELDTQVGEGILEWIQVSPAYRGLGLGTYVVTELLQRIAAKAKFATVSGKVNNPSKPENLYRRCGFKGNDVWHILRKKHGL